MNRRLAVRRYWVKQRDVERRRQATQKGFAKALGTSTTAVCNFELGEVDEFPNGKGPADYEVLLQELERQVLKDRMKKGAE